MLSKLNSTTASVSLISIVVISFSIMLILLTTGCNGGGGGGGSDDDDSTPMVTVSGYVVDINGNPINGAKVTISSDPVTVYTDNDGYFSVKVETGSHQITITVGAITIYMSTLNCEEDTPLHMPQISTSYDPDGNNADNDGDGYTTDDCDDTDAAINPGETEVPYNGKDDDCNPGTLDDDLDEDGYQSDTDCDDDNSYVNPGVAEICDDTVDNDCDGNFDCNDTDCECSTWYRDSDDDGFGDPAVSIDAESQPAGYVSDNTDCDEEDASVNPGATEICDDQKDNDCDGDIDGDDSYCISSGIGNYFAAESYLWQNPDHPNRIISIDFDNDNDLDIVLTGGAENTIPQSFAELKALRNDGQATFTDASLEVFQHAIHGGDNDYAVADFNGDNLMDLFIPDTGPDMPPFPGGQNRIYIQNQDGQLIDETMERLPIKEQFTHYCSIGDIDNDNDIDIIADMEIYINDGNGYFTANTSRLPNEIVVSPRYPAFLLLDIDNDGDNDLILGDWFLPQDTILLNDGNGFFTYGSETALPPRFGWPNSETIEVLSSDLNGDNWADLILNIRCLDNLYLQYFINNQDGTFYDASTLFPQNGRNDLFKLADLNNDDYIDLLTVDAIEFQGMHLYLNTGEGGFIEKTELLPSIFQSNWIAFNTGDFDNDGDIDIFAWTDGKYHVIENLKPFDVSMILIDAPIPPILISPENEGTICKSPTLSWSENETAKSYRLQIATDADFENIIVNRSTICSTYYTIYLNIIGTYYWRVSGSNVGGTGQWSKVWSFTTENYAPTSIAISPNAILDGSPSGTPVGQFITTDPDLGDPYTYSFSVGDGINDADNESFLIDGVTLKTNVEIDYTTKSSYNIFIKTEDGFGGTFSQALVIEVPYGLLAQYLFNGNANDASGNNHHGTVHGAVLTADRFDSENSAYSFDGIDDYIDMGTGLDFKYGNDRLSIIAWIYLYEPAEGNQYTIVGPQPNFSFTVMGENLWVNYYHDDNQYSFSGGHIVADAWHFVAVTYDGTYGRLYINNEMVSNHDVLGDIDMLGSTLLVGSLGGSIDVLNGKIDDILIFNRALSDEEILNLYEEGVQSH